VTFTESLDQSFGSVKVLDEKYDQS